MGAAASLIPGISASASQGCPPPGPLLPAPHRLAASPTFRAATERLATLLASAVAGSSSAAGWDVPNTSFSIALVAAAGDKDGEGDGNQSDGIIWEFHHRASNSSNSNGTAAVVDRDVAYMVGSISKALTVGTLLRVIGADEAAGRRGDGMRLDDSVTRYLPGLLGGGDEDTTIDWEAVTLRDLASHLAGIPTNLGLSEWYYLKQYAGALGLPELRDEDYLPCDTVGLNAGCTVEGNS